MVRGGACAVVVSVLSFVALALAVAAFLVPLYRFTGKQQVLANVTVTLELDQFMFRVCERGKVTDMMWRSSCVDQKFILETFCSDKEKPLLKVVQYSSSAAILMFLIGFIVVTIRTCCNGKCHKACAWANNAIGCIFALGAVAGCVMMLLATNCLKNHQAISLKDLGAQFWLGVYGFAGAALVAVIAIICECCRDATHDDDDGLQSHLMMSSSASSVGMSFERSVLYDDDYQQNSNMSLNSMS